MQIHLTPEQISAGVTAVLSGVSAFQSWRAKQHAKEAAKVAAEVGATASVQVERYSLHVDGRLDQFIAIASKMASATPSTGSVDALNTAAEVLLQQAKPMPIGSSEKPQNA